MTRRRWDLARDRTRIRTRGSEPVTSCPPLFARPAQPRRPPRSKAQLRQEAELALRQWRGRQP